ncbi:MAG: hypothetical protein H0T76_18340 [Nannocystis sp.]|nr:hypothetical protein [Nannocystis sp.]MBA3548446.1 hypothetical protein [Nannocystis sp.]
MDLSGRWEFSFDRDLNGQLVPTTLAHEVIFIMLDEHNFVGRLVFPPDDPSRFTGRLTTTSQGTLFSLYQVNEQSGYQALYIGKLEPSSAADARVAGIFSDLAGPDGDFRLKRIR